MNTAGRRRIGYSTLVVLLLVFVAAVMASNTLLKGMRLDLTENNLYTLSPGTKSLLAGLDEPINLYLFFSDEETADIPFIRTYEVRVRELLEEMAASSNGMLRLEVVDPEPFSEEEDRATQFGLQPVNLGTLGENVFFGLAGTNGVGDEAAIPFLQPDKEPFLEYDVARMIYSLAHPEKPVIGLLAGVPMSGGFDPTAGRPSSPWVITQQVRQLFEVRTLPSSLESIDADVDVLWLVHPSNLDEKTLYAIDQFVLRGGRALIFVDPLAEIASAAAGPSGFGAANGSNLDRLFDAWGVEFSADQVVVDNVYALSVNTGFGTRPVRHIGLAGLDAQAMDQEDVITAGLETINVGTAGHFTDADEDGGVTLTPLLTSSPEAALMPAARFQFLADPGDLLNDFSPTGERYVLAARLEGPIKSAFPDGPPGDDEAADEDEADAEQNGAEDEDAAPEEAAEAEASAADSDGADEEGEGTDAGGHLASAENVNVVLVGDVDVLSDRLWVQRQSFLGQQLITAFASNGDFVTNALDNLSGSAELIGLRSRATYSRPFTTVEALRREADAKFRATEQRLQAELDETERRLSELQSQRDDATSVLMTPEQQAEIQRFLDQQVRIRQELRAVRRNLDRSIEQLGTTLKVLNIGVMPLGLTLLTLLVFHLRRRHRKGQR
ncbi:MAG TPA: Gldg family protein [Gammaproteobacteria bacterium]